MDAFLPKFPANPQDPEGPTAFPMDFTDPQPFVLPLELANMLRFRSLMPFSWKGLVRLLQELLHDISIFPLIPQLCLLPSTLPSSTKRGPPLPGRSSSSFSSKPVLPASSHCVPRAIEQLCRGPISRSPRYARSMTRLTKRPCSVPALRTGLPA